jgi:hypothetical protein
MRYATGLYVTRADLATYVDIFRRGFDTFSTMMLIPPVPIPYWDSFHIDATDPQVVAAWRAGAVATGVPALDDVLATVQVYQLDESPQAPGHFSYRSHLFPVVRNIAEALRDVPGVEWPSQTDFGVVDDMWLEPEEGSAGVFVATYRRGWGEGMAGCGAFNVCEGMHWWSVRVAPTDAQLLSDGGDEIPDWVLEQWRTVTNGTER